MTAENDSKELKTRPGRRCNVPAPGRLCGNLGPFYCRLETGSDGTHNGDHKTHMMVKGLGRTTFRWKNQPLTPQPPVVTLLPKGWQRRI